MSSLYRLSHYSALYLHYISHINVTSQQTVYQIKLIMRSPKEFSNTSKELFTSESPSVTAWNWHWKFIVMQIGQMERIGSRSQHILSCQQEQRCPGERRSKQWSHRQAQKPSIWHSWRPRRSQFGFKGLSELEQTVKNANIRRQSESHSVGIQS